MRIRLPDGGGGGGGAAAASRSGVEGEEEEQAVAVPRCDPASRLRRAFSCCGSSTVHAAASSSFQARPLHTLSEVDRPPTWSVRCSADVTLASCCGPLGFPLFPIYRENLMCTSAYAARAQKRRKKGSQARQAASGALSRPSLFSRYASPRRDTTRHRGLPVFLHLVLPVCSLFSHSCLLSPSRHCEARAKPSAAGLATRSADGHSTSLPRLLCVSCGSGVRFWKHLHEGPGGGGGGNNPRCCCGPKQQHYRPGNERGSLQKSTRGLSAGARCRPPGGRGTGESGLGGCFISSSLGNVSRLTAQRPVRQGAAIPHEATDSKDSLDGPANAAPAT